MEKIEEQIRLTQYSHGAGCGCKISPAVLSEILGEMQIQIPFSNLLVGNDKRDDAAVFDQGDGTAIISTTDFFMPIVDDPVTFGRIAAVNAISDVYAMGGDPMMAIAILGWPINKLSSKIAGAVVEGGRRACQEAGIPLAGGHSIDSPEPIFGLAVTGKVQVTELKENSTAKEGALLFLTKGLGVGILSTAEKKGILKPEHSLLAINSMLQLNRIGTQIAKLPFVQAMTDVTGFGLFGHLVEMCKGAHLTAKVFFDNIPLLDESAIRNYIQLGAVPGGTQRNWKSYGKYIGEVSDLEKTIGCDPQTSGGLLIAIDAQRATEFQGIMKAEGFDLKCIGQMIPREDTLIVIK